MLHNYLMQRLANLSFCWPEKNLQLCGVEGLRSNAPYWREQRNHYGSPGRRPLLRQGKKRAESMLRRWRTSWAWFDALKIPSVSCLEIRPRMRPIPKRSCMVLPFLVVHDRFRNEQDMGTWPRRRWHLRAESVETDLEGLAPLLSTGSSWSSVGDPPTAWGINRIKGRIGMIGARVVQEWCKVKLILLELHISSYLYMSPYCLYMMIL